MTRNAIDISHDIRSAGAQPEVADAVAKAITTHSDERLATKEDIVCLEGKIEFVVFLARLNVGLTLGLYAALAVLFVDKLGG